MRQGPLMGRRFWILRWLTYRCNERLFAATRLTLRQPRRAVRKGRLHAVWVRHDWIFAKHHPATPLIRLRNCAHLESIAAGVPFRLISDHVTLAPIETPIEILRTSNVISVAPCRGGDLVKQGPRISRWSSTPSSARDTIPKQRPQQKK